jgi:hypothetical protein
MRLHSRGVLLTIVAVVAMSVVTAASASAALPEFKPVPAKKKFTSTSGTVTWTFNGGTETMTCTKSSAAGELTGAKTLGKLVVKFTGCTSTGTGKSGCATRSKNATNEGEIVTNALGGELGTVSTKEATSGVGLLLKPETGSTWTETVANECLHEGKLTGSLAAEVATIGKKQVTNKLVIGTSGFGQKIREITLDSGKLAEPELAMWAARITVAGTEEVTFEEALEVT